MTTLLIQFAEAVIGSDLLLAILPRQHSEKYVVVEAVMTSESPCFPKKSASFRTLL